MGLYDSPASCDNDAELSAFAEKALARCIEWFGPPKDLHWPYKIRQGDISGCLRNYLTHRYEITLTADYRELPERCEGVGHEMYHRVTMTRRGLRRTRWVDEMLACQASLQLLSEAGFDDYAEQVALHYRRLVRPSLTRMRDILRARPRPFHRLDDPDLPTFYAGTTCLGMALESIVGWPQMCRLVHFRTWPEWFAEIPSHLRLLTYRILELSQAEAGSMAGCLAEEPEAGVSEAELLRDTAWALYQKADYEAAIEACMQVIHLEPEDSHAYRYLAEIYHEQGDLDSAIGFWRKFLQRKPNSSRIRFNLGTALLQQGCLDPAIQELSMAARLKPNDPATRLNLGTALDRRGCRAEARAEWQRVLSLGNEVIARSARSLLDEYPEIDPEPNAQSGNR